jgi:hypothetical protein
MLDEKFRPETPAKFSAREPGTSLPTVAMTLLLTMLRLTGQADR